MFKANTIFGVMKSMGELTLGVQPHRTTFILRRRYKPLLHKKGAMPKEMTHRYYIYELVENTNTRKCPEISVILTENVPGVGEKSDVITMKSLWAHRELLMPGLAVYNTPKNFAKYNCDLAAQEEKYKNISLDVFRTVNYLSKMILYVTMNNNQPWKLEPWHVRSAFRRNKVHVPETAIEMPPGEITGPSIVLHDKEFFVTVTINKTEKVNVRCRIHHWEVGEKRIPIPSAPWEVKLEPLFAEQAEILSNMPLDRPEDL